MKLDTAMLTHPGRKRPNNEDACGALEDIGLFVVADGMGGHEAGEIASGHVANALLSALGLRDPKVGDPSAVLRRVIQMASREIFEQGAREQQTAGMGSTVEAAVIRDNQIYLAHVGDSRAYLLRKGAIDRLTFDHSLVGDRLRRGELTEEEARQHRLKNRINRAVGIEPDVEVDIIQRDLRKGDRLLLCSDGLHDLLSDKEIGRILQGEPVPNNAARALIEAANNAGGKDNITVAVIDIVALDTRRSAKRGSITRYPKESPVSQGKQVWGIAALVGILVFVLTAAAAVAFYVLLLRPGTQEQAFGRPQNAMAQRPAGASTISESLTPRQNESTPGEKEQLHSEPGLDEARPSPPALPSAVPEMEPSAEDGSTGENASAESPDVASEAPPPEGTKLDTLLARYAPEEFNSAEKMRAQAQDLQGESAKNKLRAADRKLKEAFRTAAKQLKSETQTLLNKLREEETHYEDCMRYSTPDMEQGQRILEEGKEAEKTAKYDVAALRFQAAFVCYEEAVAAMPARKEAAREAAAIARDEAEAARTGNVNLELRTHAPAELQRAESKWEEALGLYEKGLYYRAKDACREARALYLAAQETARRKIAEIEENRRMALRAKTSAEEALARLDDAAVKYAPEAMNQGKAALQEATHAFEQAQFTQAHNAFEDAAAAFELAFKTGTAKIEELREAAEQVAKAAAASKDEALIEKADTYAAKELETAQAVYAEAEAAIGNKDYEKAEKLFREAAAGFEEATRRAVEAKQHARERAEGARKAAADFLAIADTEENGLSSTPDSAESLAAGRKACTDGDAVMKGEDYEAASQHYEQALSYFQEAVKKREQESKQPRPKRQVTRDNAVDPSAKGQDNEAARASALDTPEGEARPEGEANSGEEPVEPGKAEAGRWRKFAELLRPPTYSKAAERVRVHPRTAAQVTQGDTWWKAAAEAMKAGDYNKARESYEQAYAWYAEALKEIGMFEPGKARPIDWEKAAQALQSLAAKPGLYQASESPSETGLSLFCPGDHIAGLRSFSVISPPQAGQPGQTPGMEASDWDGTKRLAGHKAGR